mgnify:CR=1 FL=1
MLLLSLIVTAQLVVFVVYVLVFAGALALPSWLSTASWSVTALASIVLLWRFRPFQSRYAFTRHDVTLVFGLAAVIFTNVITQAADLPATRKWRDAVVPDAVTDGIERVAG